MRRLLHAESTIPANCMSGVEILGGLADVRGDSWKAWLFRISRSAPAAIIGIREGHCIQACTKGVMNLTGALLRFPSVCVCVNGGDGGSDGDGGDGDSGGGGGGYLEGLRFRRDCLSNTHRIASNRHMWHGRVTTSQTRCGWLNVQDFFLWHVRL